VGSNPTPSANPDSRALDAGFEPTAIKQGFEAKARSSGAGVPKARPIPPLPPVQGDDIRTLVLKGFVSWNNRNTETRHQAFGLDRLGPNARHAAEPHTVRRLD
jgi:hypothetical protein